MQIGDSIAKYRVKGTSAEAGLLKMLLHLKLSAQSQLKQRLVNNVVAAAVAADSSSSSSTSTSPSSSTDVVYTCLSPNQHSAMRTLLAWLHKCTPSDPFIYKADVLRVRRGVEQDVDGRDIASSS